MVDMNEVWILAVGAGSLLSFLAFLGGKWWAGGKDRGGESAAHLEAVVRGTNLLNDNFRHSLEVVQRRLESLLLRAEETEQNLSHLMIQAQTGRAGTGKAEQYGNAALLLSEGKEVEQAAYALKLPLPQVRLIQELRQELEKERRTSLGSKQGKEPRPKEKARKENGVAPQEKIAVGKNGTSHAFATQEL